VLTLSCMQYSSITVINQDLQLPGCCISCIIYLSLSFSLNNYQFSFILCNSLLVFNTSSILFLDKYFKGQLQNQSCFTSQFWEWATFLTLQNQSYFFIKKFELRRKIDNKMKGRIIPTITKSLNAQSKNINDREVLMFGNSTTEITIPTIRHAINLEENTCSRRGLAIMWKDLHPCFSWHY
jgi:hypothetical protein